MSNKPKQTIYASYMLLLCELRASFSLTNTHLSLCFSNIYLKNYVSMRVFHHVEVTHQHSIATESKRQAHARSAAPA